MVHFLDDINHVDQSESENTSDEKLVEIIEVYFFDSLNQMSSYEPRNLFLGSVLIGRHLVLQHEFHNSAERHCELLILVYLSPPFFDDLDLLCYWRVHLHIFEIL